MGYISIITSSITINMAMAIAIFNIIYFGTIIITIIGIAITMVTTKIGITNIRIGIGNIFIPNNLFKIRVVLWISSSVHRRNSPAKIFGKQPSRTPSPTTFTIPTTQNRYG